MRRFLIIALVLLSAVSAQAAPAFVRDAGAGCSGNDCTLTFGAGWTQGNVVVVVSTASAQGSDQIDLTDIVATESDIAQQDIGATYRVYIMCFVVGASDAGDTTVIVTTTGGTSSVSQGMEFSGLTCTEDGTDQGNTDTNGICGVGTYNLTTGVTTTQANSVLVGMVRSNSASDFSASGSTVASPSSGADIAAGDDAGFALAGYILLGGTGTYDLPFCSAANETSVIFAAALQASASSTRPPRGLSILGGGL